MTYNCHPSSLSYNISSQILTRLVVNSIPTTNRRNHHTAKMSVNTTFTAVAHSAVTAMGYLPHPIVGILPPISTEAFSSDFTTTTQGLPSWTAHDRAAFPPIAIMPTDSEQFFAAFSTYVTATSLTTRVMPTILATPSTDAMRENSIHATQPTAGPPTIMRTRIQARRLVDPAGTDESSFPVETDPPAVFPPIHGPGWQPPSVQPTSTATIATVGSETEAVDRKSARNLPDEEQIVLAVSSKHEQQVDSHPICRSSTGARSES